MLQCSYTYFTGNFHLYFMHYFTVALGEYFLLHVLLAENLITVGQNALQRRLLGFPLEANHLVT